jgi:hypothetical protein
VSSRAEIRRLPRPAWVAHNHESPKEAVSVSCCFPAGPDPRWMLVPTSMRRGIQLACRRPAWQLARASVHASGCRVRRSRAWVRDRKRMSASCCFPAEPDDPRWVARVGVDTAEQWAQPDSRQAHWFLQRARRRAMRSALMHIPAVRRRILRAARCRAGAPVPDVGIAERVPIERIVLCVRRIGRPTIGRAPASTPRAESMALCPAPHTGSP